MMTAHLLAARLLALPDYDVFYSEEVSGGGAWMLHEIGDAGVFNGAQVHVFIRGLK